MDKAEIPRRIKDLLYELVDIPEDEREEQIFEEMNKLSPDPSWSDYIFHSDAFLKDDDSIDIDAVVSKIMEYKVINL